MLGFMINPAHFFKVLAVVLGLAVIGLIAGIATGVFEHNNREPLRLKREAAVLQAPPTGN
ncbi:MAG TPA: hypothetical protein VG839_09990 [Asticcacaulis sp.]|nr:hypothetical protein [Asticcacaulis sp.]